MKDNRWTKRITDWFPYNDKRSKKRSDTNWRDDIENYEKTWQRITQDRQLWKELRKAYV